jgi:lysozyme
MTKTASINQAGIELIKSFEGFRSEPYQDVVGLWTIGVGHLIQPHEKFTKLTPSEVDALLEKDLERTCEGVANCLKVAVNENQFAALVSLAFNIGIGAFSKSTLVKKLNAGNIEGAEVEFGRWNKAGGKVVDGLTRRRLAEAELFSTPVSAK